MSGALAGLAVEVDEGAKPMRFAADDCDHQRKAEHASPGEGLRCSSHPDPDRQGILQWPWIHALSGEWRAVFAGPMNRFVVTDLQEKLELLSEQRIVVFK